ncbi:MAG: DUF2071 domain-containing protein [Vicinamibacterales bacterium]
MQNDFDYGVLSRTAHRPSPMPDEPWLMTQTWHDLAFVHWPVDQQQLLSALPAGIELDIFEGQAWIGLVPFHMTNVAPRGVPALPWVSAFPELNVRTYVVAKERPGVYFFSLDAGNPVAVGLARSMLHLPYYSAVMSVTPRQDWYDYRSRRVGGDGMQPAELDASYRPTGPVFEPAEGTLEHFLTERYCLYTVNPEHRLLRIDIHHAPWPLQTGEIVLNTNTMIEPTGVRLPDMAPLVHFAKRQDMVAWRLMQVA